MGKWALWYTSTTYATKLGEAMWKSPLSNDPEEPTFHIQHPPEGVLLQSFAGRGRNHNGMNSHSRMTNSGPMKRHESREETALDLCSPPRGTRVTEGWLWGQHALRHHHIVSRETGHKPSAQAHNETPETRRAPPQACHLSLFLAGMIE